MDKGLVQYLIYFPAIPDNILQQLVSVSNIPALSSPFEIFVLGKELFLLSHFLLTAKTPVMFHGMITQITTTIVFSGRHCEF